MNSILLFLFFISVSSKNITKDDEKHYIYVIFTEECYQEIFGNTDFEASCLGDTISRIISILMVAFAIFNQMPQIKKILSSKSTQGISFDSYYTEFYLLSFIVSYNSYKSTPFLLYGEALIVLIEYAVVLHLFIFYDKTLSYQKWGFLMALFLIINVPLYIGYGPSWIFNSTIYINMFLLFTARFFQIRLNCKNGNTGQLSLLTQLQNQAGSLARLFTLFNDQADIFYIFYIFEDNTLACILTTQIINSWRKKKRLQIIENIQSNDSIEQDSLQEENI